MGRSPCCSKEGLNRGAWTAMEDKRLSDYIKIHGEGKWRNLPKRAGLNRCGKSCRLRWLNYLRPGIKRGNITHDEEELIIRLHNLLGNRWSLIAGRLPGRTDNEIKNYWNTIIGKKLQNHQQNPQFPSSGHTPLNQTEEILIPTIGNHKALPSKVNNSGDANVVRTRASRCNKVVIPPELHNDDWKQLDDTNPTVAPMSHAPENNQLVPESLVLEFNSDENNSSDLMMNFEMDGQFLSDLLNTDFSQLTSFDNGAASDSTSTIDQGYLSPNSSQTLLFTDDALQEPKFPSIDSLIESEFDWLVD